MHQRSRKYSNLSIHGSYITKALCTKEKETIIGCTKGIYVPGWANEKSEPQKIYKGDDISSFILSPNEERIIVFLKKNQPGKLSN